MLDSIGDGKALSAEMLEIAVAKANGRPSERPGTEAPRLAATIG
jgi:hypothetical protein